jgi:4-hydroxyproline epimerase
LSKAAARRIAILDSHTGGEPTRLVLDGGPDLGTGTMAQRRDVLRSKYDRWRSAIVNEPRGSDAIVGALLCEPADASCDVGIIFFNNVGVIGMCGHGTIGAVVSLAHLGRIRPGTIRIETAVGVVSAELLASGEVVVANVPSYRTLKDAAVAVPGAGAVRGDVAWGGNWFFLTEQHGLEIRLSNLEALTGYATRIRRALASEGIRGDDGSEIDHVELFAVADPAEADARNFVLCPGNAYDRSPCGTGTSAKMACLYADGKLAAGREWRQQGILGSVFHGHVEAREGRILPFIRGSAHVTAEGSLIIDDDDPFAWGIR